MILRLQHQRPDGEVDTYHLKPGRRYHIGRGSACELRILDLKLSRKHCAVEFYQGQWTVVDLMSTNGCKLNGDQVVGQVPIATGGRIEAGQTTLAVGEMVDPTALPADDQADLPESVINDGSATALSSSLPEQETLPDDSDQHAVPTRASESDWDPEPAPAPDTEANKNKSGALVPHRTSKPAVSAPDHSASALLSASASAILPGKPEARRPTAVYRIDDLKLPDEDVEKTHISPRSPTPALEAKAPTPAANPILPKAQTPPISSAPSASAPASSDERTFFITVLGRRIGPLTRSIARDLKARELKGTLTTNDLDQYPQG